MTKPFQTNNAIAERLTESKHCIIIPNILKLKMHLKIDIADGMRFERGQKRRQIAPVHEYHFQLC
ncbi:hypothetical protein TYRP_004943 [Tyrophagus putrescentiae]|nr:hypothetical protein TYRP_004943 [Tyrophagus putrescentiae]